MKIEFFQPAENTAANAVLQDAMLQRYRGFTALRGTGGWITHDGKKLFEPVEVLTVYTEDRYMETFHWLWFQALAYAKAASQEAVMFAIDGKPSIVFASDSQPREMAAQTRQEGRHAVAAH